MKRNNNNNNIGKKIQRKDSFVITSYINIMTESNEEIRKFFLRLFFFYIFFLKSVR